MENYKTEAQLDWEKIEREIKRARVAAEDHRDGKGSYADLADRYDVSIALIKIQKTKI